MEKLFLEPDFWLQLGGKLLRIALILAGTALALRFFRIIVEKLFVPPHAGLKSLYFEEKRARTLSGLLRSIGRYFLYFIALIMILQEMKVDTTSIVAGAGIVGLALSVGAQSLIKDFITGFFIILEDQYAVGDYVAIGDIGGTVEEIGFRVTKLRDFSGVLHIVPNGSIARISNHSRGHMQAVINIPVAYTADLDKVLSALNEACVEVGRTVPEVIEGPKVLGIIDMRPDNMVARVVAKTVPLEQGTVETAFRYQVRRLFEQYQIPLPTPISPYTPVKEEKKS